MTAPLLVLGVGNPSRGDDALGPLFIERLERALAAEVERGEVELLTDFQLQIEHALDLVGRARVFFVDASVRAAPPFELYRAEPRTDRSCSTHALSPGAVLAAHRQLGREPPEAWVLAIHGERFELGEPLTARAGAHLDAALSFFIAEARGRPEARAGRRLELEGTVQGVGFRPWVYRTATRLGLGGEVYNTAGGVVIEAFGARGALDALVRAVQAEAPREARVRAVRATDLPEREALGFRIGASSAGSAALGRGSCTALSLAPDLATCPECLRELGDRDDRRCGYLFSSCTACGPRFSILRALPYDRGATSMAPFVPCAACAAEYADPGDRRFHAQTIACASCGPRAWLADAHGEAIQATDPIAAAAALLLEGRILGVQGLGAFHLACDGTNPLAVAVLRERKRRDLQPFAVMVADLRAAEALAELDDAARAALSSSARPIVLVPERPGALASNVNGPSRRSGVLLPYTPLHHALLARVGRPLVMTSGNPSGGPALIDRAAACARLGAVADAFVFHDRVIERRVEDSVVAPTALGVRVLRRSRGYAPAPIALPRAAREPVLAVGGHQKNTACLVLGDQAYLTPHLGDLELEESADAWQHDLERFEQLLGVHAEVLAHDLHPDYTSTHYALERPARRRVGVQHHVAHVLAAIAELHLDEPVVGVAFDGSGFGTDGSAWGGEILIVDGARWTRSCSLRPLPLPGGERAVRETWRAAFGALLAAVGPEEALALAPRLRVFDGLPAASLTSVARMVETGAGVVPARGVGRWFDAIGALVLALPRAHFDGHVAIALEEAATSGDAAPYPVALPSALATGEPLSAEHELDLRPVVRAVVADVLTGVPAALIAARFHRTLVDATTTLVARVLEEAGLGRVVLTGGSFQNRLLERGVVERLGRSRVSMAREVPINDGGLALGQAWAAVLALESEPK